MSNYRYLTFAPNNWQQAIQLRAWAFEQQAGATGGVH